MQEIGTKLWVEKLHAFRRQELECGAKTLLSDLQNPPERPGWQFPGPNLHWDTTLAALRRFGIQGILYLAETEAAQGAFCCVPGFHKMLDAWLAALSEGVVPRAEALRTLRAKPIAAARGDLVLWHPSLPHGSSPNRATGPRVFQYMSMRPSRWAYNEEWR